MSDNMDLSKGGVKYDSNKLRFDLLPPDALEEVARVYTLGAAKYSDRNWETGMRWGRVFAATMRHLWAWARGETYDRETGLHHAAHAAFGCLSLIAYQNRDVGTDDRANINNEETEKEYEETPTTGEVIEIKGDPRAVVTPTRLRA